MSKSILLFLLLFGFTIKTFGQQINLTNDSAFFNFQLSKYETWLDSSKLKGNLQINRTDIKPELLTVYLDFNYSNNQNAIQAWEDLNKAYLEEYGIELTAKLFYMMIFYMEVPYENARIKIINTAPLSEIPSIDKEILFDTEKGYITTSGIFKTVVSGTTRLFNFELPESYHSASGKIKNISGKYSNKDIMYDILYKKSEEYFLNGYSDAKYFIRQRDSILRFDVWNTKFEVIPKESIFGLYTNPHELLIFTIRISQKEEEILINCEIDGKCGSGLFKPRTIANYREMYPDYSYELKRYIDQFLLEKLRIWLVED